MGGRLAQRRLDDRSWKSGDAALGSGTPGLATTVGFGRSDTAKHVTTYFRQKTESGQGSSSVK